MAYPANATFQHQDKSSRLWALLTLLGIKNFLLIPHMVVLFVLQLGAAIVGFIGMFAVLFTGKYPVGMEKFLVRVGNWNYRVNAYALCMTDTYPPFGMDAEYPAKISFEHQEKSSRLWAFLSLIGIKGLLLIPQIIVVYIMMIIGLFVMFLGLFAALFTGKYPQSFGNYINTMFRYMWRLQAYMMCLTDKYPPIGWKE